MHEASVALGIVEIAVSHMHNAGAARVVSVKAVVGALSGVAPEAVQFCYEAACKGTPAEGSQLVIEQAKAVAKCSQCSMEFEFSGPLAVCPGCGALGGKILSGDELYVDQIAVV